MREIGCLELVVMAPIMPSLVAMLRMDLCGEHFSADDRDPQLDPFRYVCLKDNRTESDSSPVGHIALRHNLSVAIERMSHRPIQCGTEYLTNDIAVMLAVELEEFLGVVGDQGGRQIEAQRSSDLQLRCLKFGISKHGRRRWYPQALHRVPKVIQKNLRFLYDVPSGEIICDFRADNGGIGSAVPDGFYLLQINLSFFQVQNAAHLSGR